MYCPRCKRYCHSNERFCGNCGFNIAGYAHHATMSKKKSGATGIIIAIAAVLTIGIALFLLLQVADEPRGGGLSSGFDGVLPQEVTTDTEILQVDDLREFYTTPVGGGLDVATVMLYIIGSDLESYGGFASDDIYEMLEADFGENVNVVLMTGGTTDWYIDEISDDSCQYWQIKNNELVLVDNSLGLLNMTDPATLTNFINDTAAAYPADRYSIIMWNHGGGTFSGFGDDEHFPSTTLTLEDISHAFSGSDVKFDFVGFDACLMATAETALMLEPYADYLIASQETEPELGWYYTDWLTTLGKNPSISTEQLGKAIVDDYITVCEEELYNPNATLSVIDLRYMPYAYDMLTVFFADAADGVRDDDYLMFSTARNHVKDFGDGDFEQIDIVDYIRMVDVEDKAQVIDAVSEAVVYHDSSYDVKGANGMAIYFPYDYPNYYDEMQELLHNLGFSNHYTEFFNVFISAMSGGQSHGSQSYGGISVNISDEDWYDEETADSYEQNSEITTFSELIIDEKDDSFVLSLTDDQWAEINTIELQVLMDDGEGYIDLGSDNVYEFDDDGDLKIEFDYTWVAIDQNIVPFYMEEEDYISDDWYTFGYVPAFLNDEEYVEVILYWDANTPSGYVAGYRRYTDTGDPIAKGLFSLEPGDTLSWIIDYYTYDLEYEDWYYFGDTYIVPSTEMVVGYEYVGDMDAMAYFVLTDYYNNVYETEAVIYSDY